MLFILKKLITLQLVLLVVEGPEWLVAEKHERPQRTKKRPPIHLQRQFINNNNN